MVERHDGLSWLRDDDDDDDNSAKLGLYFTVLLFTMMRDVWDAVCQLSNDYMMVMSANKLVNTLITAITDNVSCLSLALWNRLLTHCYV